MEKIILDMIIDDGFEAELNERGDIICGSCIAAFIEDKVLFYRNEKFIGFMEGLKTFHISDIIETLA